MSGRFVFDIETNGFLETMNTIHSLVLKNIDTGEVISCMKNPLAYTSAHQQWGIEEGLRMLMDAELIIGHNIVVFDIPAIQKVHPWFQPYGTIRDTLLMARMLWPDVGLTDDGRIKAGTLPNRLRGRHSLEAYGYRLGLWKGDYSEVMKSKGLDPWAEWNPDMQSYCEQDVEVNARLWQFAQKRASVFSDESFNTENRVAQIIQRQIKHGFGFDEEKAHALYLDLIERKFELERQLKETFKPWWSVAEEVTVTKTRREKLKDAPWKPAGYRVLKGGPNKGQQVPEYHTALYEEGAVYSKLKWNEFNPGSRDHIAQRLIKLRGWRPTEFGKDGKPTVDDTILSQLPWPEAKLVSEYLMIVKRIGAVAEGNEAWLKRVRDGRIHGNVMSIGTPTARMTHSSPNVAQTPANDAPYGERCRELFIPSKGRVLVGCDADALELRCLAGYMAKYDDGAYIETVLRGNKAEGTDMHSVNSRAIGLDPKKMYTIDGSEQSGRDIAKTWFYAFIYGAGDWKLGYTLGVRGTVKDITSAGATSRATFLENLPALGTITNECKRRAKQYGRLPGIDGRKLFVRHQHAALNTLLQGAGAIFMKKALVILDDDLTAAGLSHPWDYEFCANIHDEWQIDVVEAHAETVGRLAADAIRKAGEAYDFKCPLAGNFEIGRNWKETH